MSAHVGYGNDWKDIQNLYACENNVWVPAKELYACQNNEWGLVWPVGGGTDYGDIVRFINDGYTTYGYASLVNTVSGVVSSGSTSINVSNSTAVIVNDWNNSELNQAGGRYTWFPTNAAHPIDLGLYQYITFYFYIRTASTARMNAYPIFSLSPDSEDWSARVCPMDEDGHITGSQKTQSTAVTSTSVKIAVNIKNCRAEQVHPKIGCWCLADSQSSANNTYIYITFGYGDAYDICMYKNEADYLASDFYSRDADLEWELTYNG